MVREIKSNGRLKLHMLGGYVERRRVRGRDDQTRDGRRYRGTVVPVKASVHVHRGAGDEKRTQGYDGSSHRRANQQRRRNALWGLTWVILCSSTRVWKTDTGFIRSRHLDDKASVACIYGVSGAARRGAAPGADGDHRDRQL